jgi:alanyl-tRNA synthetase
LFVTVFEDDDEAFEIWDRVSHLPKERIMRFNAKSNFWEMGDTGPCGPCSEIHYDRGDLATQAETFADPVKGVNGANDRYIEIWNNVFMQYERISSGELIPLKAKNVDTGMGFERYARFSRACAVTMTRMFSLRLFRRLRNSRVCPMIRAVQVFLIV